MRYPVQKLDWPRIRIDLVRVANEGTKDHGLVIASTSTPGIDILPGVLPANSGMCAAALPAR